MNLLIKIFLIIYLLSSYLWGVTLSPLTKNINSIKKNRMLFIVSNPSNEPVACEFEILELNKSNSTKEERVASDDFIYFPSQFVLKAKEKRSIRVRYMRNKIPDIENVYRVIAKELDVSIKEDIEIPVVGKSIKSKIKVRFSYAGLIFVGKIGLKSDLRVVSFFQNKKGLQITIKNFGNKSDIACIDNNNLYLQIEGKKYKMSSKECRQMSFKRVLPSQQHTYTLIKSTNNSLYNKKIESIKIKKGN